MNNRKIASLDGIRYLFYVGLAMGTWLGGATQFCVASEIGQTSTKPQTPAPNAFDFYQQAGAALIQSDQIAQASVNLFDGKKVPTGTLQNLLSKNTRALQLLRAGFRHSYRHPVLKDMEAAPPEYSHLRNLVRLLILEGEFKARRGDKSGAASCYLDGVRIGVDVPRGGAILPLLVGCACETLARRALWRSLSQMDAATARAATTRLGVLAAQRVRLSAAMREEKHMALASLPAMIRRSDVEASTRLAPHAKQIETNIAAWMDETIANLEKPYTARQAVTIPIDPLSQVYLPMYDNLGFQEARNLTGDALLTVALALRAHRMKTKNYPASLDELALDGSKKIPADPFGNGEALRYRLATNGYLLYSIGPDGKDDAGRAIETKTQSSHRKFAVAAECKGDFVAGVNY